MFLTLKCNDCIVLLFATIIKHVQLISTTETLALTKGSPSGVMWEGQAFSEAVASDTIVCAGVCDGVCTGQLCLSVLSIAVIISVVSVVALYRL